MARPTAPSNRPTSTSTVGLPRESNTSLPIIESITSMWTLLLCKSYASPHRVRTQQCANRLLYPDFALLGQTKLGKQTVPIQVRVEHFLETCQLFGRVEPCSAKD